MKPALWRLILTAALFVGWLGYLTYLVCIRPSVVLSRPQFLVSMLDIVGRVDNIKGEDILVEKVLFPETNPSVKAGDKIQVENIAKCRPLSDPLEKNMEPSPDWMGPGPYILPLQLVERDGKGHYEVVPTPASPGYHGLSAGPPRIYPATVRLLDEYKRISKPK
jgi:hypothetical protein